MTQWLTEDEQRAWRSYLDATRLLMQTLDRQLTRDSGISFTDFELLVVLSEAPGRQMRMRDLADAVTTTRSGVTRAITRLVDAGWVVRVECEDDRRGMLAELTDAGMDKLAASSPGHVGAVRASMFDVLTDDDVATFTRAYSDMRTHIQKGAG
ncbi:MarR family transcriptional regulator [Rhodococcus sp. BP-149]|uniref:MarR family winged helix-turn-helix transcriptional regulator n=1 Tax=unclassified Rhodococcus (in: high G+C Gram-positive bacteria) TaxID=192944 RepID=UPI001C9AA33D|nr:MULTISPECIES: MarR family transcriptional regulator [unclassified Rhodococcus (in: high G+C Gram-positive bacteria)]MBY6684501.1 MarR family transcriptional regulator [Rhodococcus sp. BP-288]MBY6695532.1 MarR family transcriptional regulator [Rhodococcus sp. BP-188]MBY6698913.1 MarR family transcriptional regulator [Rhodococcus sp. BP-285]MBY6701592.1 MarR family transcriptional regulator [Rhodococcus sp. BP-283]MBY6712593.1 MarR family transcriptional regulator [Rhodococcus sp. BP-160]